MASTIVGRVARGSPDRQFFADAAFGFLHTDNSQHHAYAYTWHW